MTETVDAFYGFQLKNRFYVVLSQDGKPSQVGKKILDEIMKGYKGNKLDTWKQKLLESKIVFEESIPSQDDLIQYKHMLNGYDGSNWTFLDEYYIHHKSLEKIVELGLILNSVSPQGNPNVVPYGYVLNLDDNRFDIYIEHERISSLEDRFGTLIPVLKEKLDLGALNKNVYQRVIDKYELGLGKKDLESSDESNSETDFETSHSEIDTDNNEDSE